MVEKELKKLSLKNEKLKASRASETEEQRKERLRIRVKMIEQEGAELPTREGLYAVEEVAFQFK